MLILVWKEYKNFWMHLKLIISKYEHKMPKYYFEIGRVGVLHEESGLNLEETEEILTANKYLHNRNKQRGHFFHNVF